MNIKQKSLSNAGKMERWREEKIKKKKETAKKYYSILQKHVNGGISFPV